uniref:Uncharacterized protein n=1 Tax=viral metagenome TaxID=1070528 RepID=A0A6M3K1I1_9ZZZZ
MKAQMKKHDKPTSEKICGKIRSLTESKGQQLTPQEIEEVEQQVLTESWIEQVL